MSWYSTHSEKYTLVSNKVSITPIVGSIPGDGIKEISLSYSSIKSSGDKSDIFSVAIATRYGTLSYNRFI